MKNEKSIFVQARERGVALMMVLVGIAIITAVVLEFAYQTDVTYNLSYNDLDKTKARALAESGLQFSKLIIKLDQEAKGMAGKSQSSIARSVGNIAIYNLIPIDTEQLRAQAYGTPLPVPTGEEEAPEVPPVEQTPVQVPADESKPEDFFNFAGDFFVNIQEEDTKLNVNLFNLKTPSEKSYSQLKSILYHLLATDEFKGMFEDRYTGAQDLAQNIADFVDRDEVANQSGGYDRGREGLQDSAQVTMKNARLLSLEELILVPGMQENVFQKLKKYLTVYGSSEKVLLCRSEPALQKAFIIAYSEDNPNLAPIADDNEDLLNKGIEAFQNYCPEPQDVIAELDRVLGVSQGGGDQTPPANTGTGKGSNTGSTAGTESTGEGLAILQWMKKEAVIFSVLSTGRVGESQVKIKTVFDTSSGNPAQWKELYWRVE